MHYVSVAAEEVRHSILCNVCTVSTGCIPRVMDGENEILLYRVWRGWRD